MPAYHNPPAPSTPPHPFFFVSQWVPQPLPGTDLWMLYRVEKRYDSEDRCVSTRRITLSRFLSKQGAIRLAEIFAAESAAALLPTITPPKEPNHEQHPTR